MIPYKLNLLLTALTENGCDPRPAGDEYRARCPAHEDSSPSLYVRAAEDKILLRCSAGCPAADVCEKLDVHPGDLFIGPDDPLVEADAPGPAGPERGYPDLPADPVPVPVADDGALRHDAYTGVLGTLELSTSDFDALAARGLTGDEITRRMYKTASNSLIGKAVDNLLAAHPADRLLAVPGFHRRGDRLALAVPPGLVIPVRAAGGQVVALKVRQAGDGRGKYVYVSGRGASCGNPVHVPLGVAEPIDTVRLTEGELKADVATALSGVPTISAPGVTNWKAAVPVLKAMGAKTVLLAFDQDGKPGTKAATEQALFGLARDGFEVRLEVWDPAAGKGIDDLLAGGGTPSVLAGLAAAVHVRDAVAAPKADPVGDEPDDEPVPFPADQVFPPALARFNREAGEATATPPDYAGLAMLVTAAAAIGNSRAVCLKENSWYEGPRIYAAPVGDPASGKTPAVDLVVRPYQAIQQRRLAAYRQAKAEYDRRAAEHDRAERGNRAAAEADRVPLDAPPAEPARPERLVVNDVTVESLAPILEDNPRGLLMPLDEGVSWVRGMNQYKGGRGADKQFWLSAWSGQSHLVDRKAQGGIPISIPRPLLNVLCPLPPDMLGELVDQLRRNDGFTDRILFAYPRSAAGAEWTDVTVSGAARAAWEATLTGLRKLDMVELEDGVPGYRVVHLAPAARDAWVAWYNAHAAEMRDPDLPAELIGPYGKLKAYCARLALVLHYLWLVQGAGDEGDVGADSVHRAVTLIDYFKGHARRVYGQFRRSPEDDQVLGVLDWVRRNGGQATARDLLRAKRAPNAEKAKKLLRELEERGYGRCEAREAPNGKRVTWFVFDPA